MWSQDPEVVALRGEVELLQPRTCTAATIYPL